MEFVWNFVILSKSNLSSIYFVITRVVVNSIKFFNQWKENSQNSDEFLSTRPDASTHNSDNHEMFFVSEPRDLSSLKWYLFQDNSYTSSYDGGVTRHPHFLKVPTTVSVIEGSAVILSCRIENLDERMVFWIRNYDLQILTAGLVTFTADERFTVIHENSIDATDWSLLITNVKIEDQGLYECQINTEPKMKLNINLMVKGEKNFIYYSWIFFFPN